MQVSKLSIAGYRSIREIRDIELDRLNLIIGANGSGKTNLYRSMELLQAAAQGIGMEEAEVLDFSNARKVARHGSAAEDVGYGDHQRT